ncbi:MAG: hypothetical protein HY986_00255 [Candidatus Melainabacteria bacterium]|nr:hypothetical protein [Candidatus Melainabacteria bacterium]
MADFGKKVERMALLGNYRLIITIQLMCLGPAREKCLPFLEIVRRVLVNSNAKAKCKVRDVKPVSILDNDYSLLEFTLPRTFGSAGVVCEIRCPKVTTDVISPLWFGPRVIGVLFCVDASSRSADIAAAFEELNAQLAVRDYRLGYKYDAVPILAAVIGDSEADFALVPSLESLLPVENLLVHKLHSQNENDILRAFSALINAVYISTELGEHESSDLTVHAEG